MADLFGIDTGQLFLDTLGDLIRDAILTVSTPGTRTGGSLTHGTQPTTDDKTCKGYIEDYTDNQIDSTLVAKGDRKVVLLVNSIQDGVTPDTGDSITIEDITFEIIDVEKDTLKAIYICQGRVT